MADNPYCELPPFFERFDATFLRQLIDGEAGSDAPYHKSAGNEPNPDVAHLYGLKLLRL